MEVGGVEGVAGLRWEAAPLSIDDSPADSNDTAAVNVERCRQRSAPQHRITAPPHHHITAPPHHHSTAEEDERRRRGEERSASGDSYELRVLRG